MPTVLRLICELSTSDIQGQLYAECLGLKCTRGEVRDKNLHTEGYFYVRENVG